MRGLAVGLAVIGCVSVAKATPFASGITNIGGTGTIQFIMNEAGGAVSYITYPSGTSNYMGVLPVGKTNFTLGGGDTSYAIYCTKLGNGTPAQITVDTDTNGFNFWTSPRGMDINKNPTNGSLFGRMYIANSTPGANGTPPQSRGRGLYAINADCSDSYLGLGTNASYTATFTSASSSSPFNVSINPDDNTVDIADFSTANATVYKVDANFQNPAIVVLNPVGENQGLTAGTHGDPTSSFTTGSIAAGNLEVWTFDPALGAPATAALGLGNEGPTTSGAYNILYRYDVGAGPLPWNGAPNSGVNLGLPGFQDSQTGSVTLGPDKGTNFVYGQFFRANLSDPCVQVFANNSGTYNLAYSSFTNGGAGDAFQSAYAQLRVSPDGKYLAAITINNKIIIANLTNGIPDNSTLITIANTSSVGNARGLAFDAADNIYEVSSGQGLLRGYSLGNSATTISSNDYTGNNGSFQLVLPGTTATVAATTPLASQNYINSSPAGTPIPGVFTISLTTNFNFLPVAINITLGGTAGLNTNYTINSTDANGVTYTKNLITFPAGTSPSGNWTANLIVTPTATPVSGPSYSVIYTMTGGGNYVAGSPKTATISIANTGPQYLALSAASSGTSMNRGIPNDYAKFVVTRWGDTNGPIAAGGTPLSYTVTNITYTGTANFSGDYGAQAQRLDTAGNGVAATPTAGSPGIKINPGDVTINCDVGMPVANVNVFATPVNKTIIVDLTNSVAGTNGTSAENLPYTTGLNNVTMTEIDNARGPETVIWSDPLTNALDSGWSMTYASTNMGGAANTILPAFVSPYTNTETQMNLGGTNDFQALFGNPVANDSIPVSPIMAANGWTTALRVTANKDGNFAPAAVNLYPTGQNFVGNVALRFSMYLSTYDFARGNPGIGTPGREFALFGIDHYGTNCNWRPTAAVAAGTGSGTTNSDGQWFAIDGGTGSLTPADYDAFNSAPLPNSGTTDIQSNPNTADTGIFKDPPFTNDMSLSGGSPANLWVDVDVEKTQTTNGQYSINTFIDRGSVVAQFQTTNMPSNGQLVGNYTNGTIMLGYEDPVGDQSDVTAYVYYSNVRVVELSPFISALPSAGGLTNMIVLKGSNITLSATATYATAPITNNWYKSTVASVIVGGSLQTDTTNATTMTDTLVQNNIQTGTNYIAVFSDPAGASGGVSPFSIEVITPSANLTAATGAKATFAAIGTSGPSAPTAYQWYTNGVALVNGTKYTNVTTSALSVSNVQTADALTYSCKVTNPYGFVTTASTLTVATAPTDATVTPGSQTVNWGANATFTVTPTGGTAPFTYQWKKNGTNIAGATLSTLTFASAVETNGGFTYTAGVTNAAGGVVSSTGGSLTVVVPPPSISPAVGVGSPNVTLTFSSTNSTDNSSAFTLQSSPVVTGPYTNTPGTFTGSGGSFQVTTPTTTNTSMFYRLLHN